MYANHNCTNRPKLTQPTTSPTHQCIDPKNCHNSYKNTFIRIALSKYISFTFYTIYINPALLLLVIAGVPVFTPGHVLGCVTPLGLVIVHLSHGAAQGTGFQSVQAHVELLAVGGMGVLGVHNHLSGVVGASAFLGARESVAQLLLVHAAGTAGGVGPHAVAAVLVKVQSVGAGQLGKVSINAVVELVADRRVGMGEESVEAGAVGVALGRLQLSPISAVNVEGLVALVHLTDALVEDQTVRAQLLCGHTVDALVVFVALYRILVLVVLGVGRALEAGLGAYEEEGGREWDVEWVLFCNN